MLRDAMKEHLTRKILPFWEKLADRKFGGYYGYMDEDLRVDRNADKGCILNSRILWTFSTAGRVLQNAEYRECADRAYEFLSCFDDPENGGVFWSVTCDGKPADTTKHTYCQAFAIYGLAAYYRLTGNAEALKRAYGLFDVIEEKCADPDGYGEAFRADFSPESNEKLSENGVLASRTMNTLLHVIEAYTELYRAGSDERVRRAGAKALTLMLRHFWNPEKHRLEVFCDAEYHSLLDMQSYGHDIEAGWLLWDSAETLLPYGERAMYHAMCLSLTWSVYERAFTEDGVKNERVSGVTDETRVWWVQAEAMLGFAFAWRQTGECLWIAALMAQWNAIRRLIIDPRENGEWYQDVSAGGAPSGKPAVEEWKCPYHNSRMCLRLIEANLPV